jgi:hypothetical protein
MMDFAHPFLVCTLAVIFLCIYLVGTKEQLDLLIDVLISRLPVTPRRRRLPTSRTPPRSLSPAKMVSANTPRGLGYQDVFPPSCREALVSAAQRLPDGQRRRLVARDIDQAEFTKRLIPLTADFATCEPNTYTPTRLSTDEIKTLGDFPDYAELSGVPLPEAYEGFKIETALPRPYRPLRWAYHQTMCMLT